MRQSKTELFLDRVVAAANPVFDEVVAVQRAGDEELQVRTIYESTHADEGPVFAVACALGDAQGPAVILAVDYPAITSEVLRDLVKRFEESSAAMVVPVWRGIAQPLCAGYRPTVLPLIESRLEQRKLDLLGLMKDAAADTFVFDGWELLNVNTPDELREAERVR